MDSTPKRSADPQRHVPTNKDKCLKNDFNNADAAATSDPTESEKSKTANINSQSKNGNNDPSSNSPDPRRTPLLSRIPFAPTPISKRTRGGIGATAMGSPRGKKDVTPAYAYKNAETGLLEIRTVIPPSLSMVGNEDDTVVGLPEEDKKDATKLALYPIALNGGRAGLYNDPRDFLPAHSSWELCRNNRADGLSTNPSKGHVKFEHPNSHRKEMLQGAVSNAYTNLDVDLETGLKNALSNDNADTKSAEPRPRQSFGTLMTAVNPWKIWEHIHNEMSRVAAHKTRQLEDESSHATIARQKNKASMVSSIYNDNDFDFALVLAPHEAYAFWAHHLDFREEALHFIDDPGIDLELEEKGLPDDNSTIATNQRAAAATKCEIIAKTPIDASGLRRRKRATPTSEHVNSSNKMNSSKVSPAISPGIRHPSHASPYRIRTAEKMGNRIFQQRKSLFERAIIDRISPKRGSDGSAVKNSCNITTAEESISSDPENFGHPTPASDIKSPYVPRRRWGNAYDNNRLSTPNLTSPPIVSLKKGSSVKKRVKSNQKKNGGSFLFPNLTPGGRKEKQKVPGKSSVYGTGTVGKKVQGSEYIDRNVKPKSNKRTRACSDLDDKYNNADVGTDSILPSTSIPRGISARINGLGAFLEALKIGIVVRRHCPRGKAAFVKLFSDDGGDTIEFLYITDDEALIALREQEQRYNSRRRRKKARISFGESDARRWSGDSQTINKRDKIDTTVPLPDYLKAKIDREEDIRKKGGLKNAITHGAMNWLHAGVIRASEIVQVHPAAHVDPYSKTDQLGTPSLRLSQTPYVKSNTFSVILPSMQGKLVKQHFPSADMTEKWCHGSGHRSLFRSYDFEAATEGEYWVIFRGLLQIHRDASSGRFAAHRAGGFGSMTKYSDVMDVSENRVAENSLIEVLPQPEKTKLFHQVLKNFRVLERSNAASPPQIPIALANPPPPDYFLGFSSPGTQIWGRLRQAGLETQRLYSLDTKKVMIKVRCPVDRLQDVAEALKLKLKTKEGDYAPFREDMVSHFLPTNDGFVSYDDGEERIASLFRSSERQKIIDFVIGSRIRDSGAELGASTPLGKHIQRRVPLHSHARLEALYKCWVLFWLQSNWNNRDGRGLRVDSSKLNSPISSSNSRSMKHCYSKEEKSIETVNSSSAPGEQEPSPSFLYRLVVGCFYQPLDSIEEYYGEKVAFYFAWLQHCSFHLLYLSFVGAIVFICQLSSGNWDHPLRPFFSIFVMIWSFVVMVTWRRRSNFLAYQWGTLDYQEEEIARPEFKGTEYRVCPITNTYVMYYPPWKRWLKMCVSIPLTVGCTIVTLLGILILYGNRDVMLAQYFATGHSYHISVSMDVIGQTAPILAVELNKEHLRDPDFWIIIIGFPTALGLILPLLNFCLRKVSLWLNELENHRTEAEYRTHFIIKVFAFRFVCYFAALYYYSFIGVGTTDPQATEHGIVRVASTLFTYITIAHWWNICINVFFPLLLYRWRIYRDRLRLKKELRKLEKAELELTPSLENCLSAEKRLEKKKQLLNKRLLLEHAQANIWEEIVLPEHDSFTEYLFAVTQFAYVTCFSVILPITPLIVLFNHLLNMRLDAFKLCRGRRRPLALKTGGIGVWNHVLHVVTVIAILTNCSLMALTSSQFSWLANEIGTLGVFALAIGWEHFMLLVKYIMQLTVSRMPQTVQDEIRRKKYDQERKRYMQLRLKKRNSSYGTTEKKKSSITSSKKSPSVFKKDEQVTDCSEITKSTRAVACPPIEEASSNMSGSSIFEGNDERTSFDDLAEAIKHLPQPPVPSNEDVKNYALHQSFTDSSRGGSKRKANKSKVINTSPFANTILENHNPNLEKSAQIKRRPSFTQPHNRSPLQSRNPYLGYSPQLDNQGRAQREEHEEEVISPTSTITTVQYPTPRQLHPTGDDDSLSTLSTVRPGTNTNCFYHNATAPPMPADDFDEHSETQFHEIFLSDDTGDLQRSPLYDTPTHLTQARWGIHHSLYFNHSERISEKKKSR